MICPLHHTHTHYVQGPTTGQKQVFTQALDLFSTDHGDMGLCVSLTLFSLSIMMSVLHSADAESTQTAQFRGWKSSTALSLLLGWEGEHLLQPTGHRRKLRPSHAPKSFCHLLHSPTGQGLSPLQRKAEEQQEQGSELRRGNTPWRCTSSLQLSKCTFSGLLQATLAQGRWKWRKSTEMHSSVTAGTLSTLIR